MAQLNGSQTKASQSSGGSEENSELLMMNFVPAELAEIGKKRIEAIMEIQKEFLSTFEAINQAWFDRAKSVANLTTELVTKLSSARSMPETATAYQDCMGKRMEMLADDSRRMFADSQKFLHLGTRILATGASSEVPHA